MLRSPTFPESKLIDITPDISVSDLAKHTYGQQVSKKVSNSISKAQRSRKRMQKFEKRQVFNLEKK